jgi:hypothetical protein
MYFEKKFKQEHSIKSWKDKQAGASSIQSSDRVNLFFPLMLLSEKTYSKVNYNIIFFNQAVRHIYYIRCLLKSSFLKCCLKKIVLFQAFRSLSVDHFKLKQRGMQNAKWFCALRKTPNKACAEVKQWSQARDSGRDGDANPIRHLNNCSELVLV